MKNLLDKYQKETGITLTEEQIKLYRSIRDFDFKHRLFCCDICEEALSEDDLKGITPHHAYNITCQKHRHLESVFALDAYYHRHGTFDVIPNNPNNPKS